MLGTLLWTSRGKCCSLLCLRLLTSRKANMLPARSTTCHKVVNASYSQRYYKNGSLEVIISELLFLGRLPCK